MRCIRRSKFPPPAVPVVEVGAPAVSFAARCGGADDVCGDSFGGAASGGLKRSAAFGTRRTSRTMATLMVTLAVIFGRRRSCGFGTSIMTG